MGGPIRFVGGHYHNQTIEIASWIPFLTLPVKPEQCFHLTEITVDSLKPKYADYRLVQLWKYGRLGTVYFCEYRCTELTHQQAMELRRDKAQSGDGDRQ